MAEVYIPDALARKLDRYATARRRKRTQIVQEALERQKSATR